MLAEEVWLVGFAGTIVYQPLLLPWFCVAPRACPVWSVDPLGSVSAKKTNPSGLKMEPPLTRLFDLDRPLAWLRSTGEQLTYCNPWDWSVTQTVPKYQRYRGTAVTAVTWQATGVTDQILQLLGFIKIQAPCYRTVLGSSLSMALLFQLNWQRKEN